MTTQQPEALDLADWLEAVGGGPSAKRCAALLREQHARIAELESELEAVGAGGVSGPLMGIAAPPTAQAEAENLRKALQFYADKQHFAISEEDARDTAMVEDGSIAKMALAGQPINFADEDEDEAAPPTSAEGVEHG
jgi:hypothetical protein